jgi:hypothetical protein
VTHERLQRDDIAAALAQEAIRETVAQLVRGEPTNTGPLTRAKPFA